MPPPGFVATPPGVPVNTVPQNIVGNIAGMGTIMAANAGTAVANQVAGLGATEATVVAQVQGFFCQSLKHWKHWDEKHWNQPFMALIGIPVAYLLHGGSVVAFDFVAAFKSLVTSIQGVKLAIVEYEAAQATVVAGIVKPVAPEHEYANVPHLWPTTNSPGWGMTQLSPPPSSTSGAPGLATPAGPPTAGAPAAATFPNPMSWTPGVKA